MEENKKIQLKLYENQPFDDDFTVIGEYEEKDAIDMLFEEGIIKVPRRYRSRVDNGRWVETEVKIVYMKATRYATINGTVVTNYEVYYTMNHEAVRNGWTTQVEDLPAKMRNIKIDRLI